MLKFLFSTMLLATMSGCPETAILLPLDIVDTNHIAMGEMYETCGVNWGIDRPYVDRWHLFIDDNGVARKKVFGSVEMAVLHARKEIEKIGDCNN